MKKEYLVYAAVLLFVVLAGVFFWQQKSSKTNIPPKEEVKAYEFSGRIDKIEGSVIYTKGPFVITEQPEIKTTDYEKDMQIVVGNNTKLIKMVQIMPTQAELKKSNGFYEPGKLKTQEVAGSLQDLIDGVTDGVFAKSDKNIINEKSFIATEIKYYVREYPKE